MSALTHLWSYIMFDDQRPDEWRMHRVLKVTARKVFVSRRAAIDADLCVGETYALDRRDLEEEDEAWSRSAGVTFFTDSGRAAVLAVHGALAGASVGDA